MSVLESWKIEDEDEDEDEESEDRRNCAVWRGLETSCLAAELAYPERMEPETFTASRWTRGNHLFPTVIEVTDKAVIRHKRSWFNKDEISISITKVASVHIKTGIFWSDILIESSGGTDPFASHGHRKADAQRIRTLVEAAQGILSGADKLKEA